MFSWHPQYLARAQVDVRDFGHQPIGIYYNAYFHAFPYDGGKFGVEAPLCDFTRRSTDELCAAFAAEPIAADDNVWVVRVTPVKPFGMKQTWTFPKDIHEVPRMRALMGSYAMVLSP